MTDTLSSLVAACVVELVNQGVDVTVDVLLIAMSDAKVSLRVAKWDECGAELSRRLRVDRALSDQLVLGDVR